VVLLKEARPLPWLFAAGLEVHRPMWVLRRWLVLPSHFPLVLLEARGRKEVRMKERQLVEEEVQGLSGKEQERPVSREDWKDLGSVEVGEK